VRLATSGNPGAQDGRDLVQARAFEVRARLAETQVDRDDWRRKVDAADERECALLADMRKPRRWWPFGD
jgi:hypothetical protein